MRSKLLIHQTTSYKIVNYSALVHVFIYFNWNIVKIILDFDCVWLHALYKMLMEMVPPIHPPFFKFLVSYSSGMILCFQKHICLLVMYSGVIISGVTISSCYFKVTGEPLIQRKDDTAAVLKSRLEAFHRQTEPVCALSLPPLQTIRLHFDVV